MGVFESSAVLLVNAIGGIYLLAVLLRFLLQIARADFYNPVSQAVVRLTDPMVRIFRSFIPGYRGIDFSSLILAVLVEALAICLIFLMYERSIPSLGFIITWAVVGVILLYREHLLLRDHRINHHVICHDVLREHEPASNLTSDLATYRACHGAHKKGNPANGRTGFLSDLYLYRYRSHTEFTHTDFWNQ